MPFIVVDGAEWLVATYNQNRREKESGRVYVQALENIVIGGITKRWKGEKWYVSEKEIVHFNKTETPTHISTR